ncbi:subtilisin family serine protease [Thermocatellispora tengchongensis]|uniref:Subtilisin family serine protease n=1 Tax=Thermocatellispora tengchongensis TaxID=1073253 RepID=A0A840PJ91_9ACTN|nr:S8 family serine peptidase [Thermocatellispora tengchongensis]MBB5138956.1 subtilisin family serine protease [Thermocatellispora tengchongensis]
MTRKYCVLRDMSRASTSGPFEAGAGVVGGIGRIGEVAAEPRVESVVLSKRELRDVARDPEVAAVAPVMPTSLVAPVEAEGDVSGGAERAGAVTWGVRAVGADVSAFTGDGVVVAVLDTGIDPGHAAFAGMTLVEEDFTGMGTGDKVGHGTHCAGTIFGRAVEGTRIGVAPGVQKALIGKVLGDDGSGSTEGLMRGLQWALAGGAQVISLSLEFDFPRLVDEVVGEGMPVRAATSLALESYRANLRLFDAFMQLVAARAGAAGGTVVVAAAGNGSRRNASPPFEIAVALPAAAQGVISVGALRESAQGLAVAPFSNTFPQISAPGVDVVSASSGGGLRSSQGTSMAAPHVAGAAALWWEQVLGSPVPATAATVTARLLAGATVAPLAGDDVADRGVGIVRAP